MNKTKIIIIFLIGILILVIIMIISANKKTLNNQQQPIPIFSPSPSTAPSFKGATTQQEELQAEKNFALERAKILEAKPWIIKMPIRTEDYWINYSTERDAFDILIYYSGKFPKDEQITRIKKRVANDLGQIGVDVNKVKINYTEKEI